MAAQRTVFTLAGVLSLPDGGCAPSTPGATSFAVTSPVETTQASTTTGESSGSESTSGSGSSAPESTSSSGSGSSSGMLWDLGTTPDAGVNTPLGCKGKVDFLFAISREWSMEGDTERLVASFKPFIESIKGLGQQFEDFDFHIMVVNPDGHWGLPYCDEQCAQEGVCDVIPEYLCDYEPTVCDEALGAGIIINTGGDASNKNCGLAAGKRYLDKHTWNLEETFACIAQVGYSGQADLGNAIAAAVSTQRDTCNQGFLRDDALLVVMHAMHGPPQPGVKGSPLEWSLVLLDAKGGDEDAIVMLGMNGYDKYEECLNNSRSVCEMLEWFPHSVYANLYEPNYGPAFQAAVDLIDVACTEFVPG